MKKYVIFSALIVTLTGLTAGFGGDWNFDSNWDDSFGETDWGDPVFNESKTVADPVDDIKDKEKDLSNGIERVQYDFAQGETATASFDHKPDEGNLLIAVSTHRYSSETPEMKSEGWTLLTETTSSLHDSDYRRGKAIWYKEAGEDESTTVSTTWKDLEGRHNLLVVQEFQGDLKMDSYSTHTSGDNSVNKISTGKTNPVSEGSLVVGINAVRSEAGNASWTNNLDNNVQFLGDETYPKTVHSSYKVTETSGKVSSEVSWNGEEGAAIASVLVFKPEDSSSDDSKWNNEKSENKDWFDENEKEEEKDWFEEEEKNVDEEKEKKEFNGIHFEEKNWFEEKDWFDEKEKKEHKEKEKKEKKEKKEPKENQTNETVYWQVDFAEGDIPSPPSYYPRDLMAALGNTEDGVTENPANLRQDRQGELKEVQIQGKSFQFNGENPTQATVSFTLDEKAEERKLHLASFRLPGPFDIDELDQQVRFDQEVRTFEGGESGNMTVQLPTQ